MKYTIKELPTFSVIGLEQTLTEKKSQNLERCLSFWPYFNQQLKRNRLGQKGIWTKYAFMTRREGQFYYLWHSSARDCTGKFSVEGDSDLYLFGGGASGCDEAYLRDLRDPLSGAYPEAGSIFGASGFSAL